MDEVRHCKFQGEFEYIFNTRWPVVGHSEPSYYSSSWALYLISPDSSAFGQKTTQWRSAFVEKIADQKNNGLILTAGDHVLLSNYKASGSAYTVEDDGHWKLWSELDSSFYCLRMLDSSFISRFSFWVTVIKLVCLNLQDLRTSQ